MRTFHRKQSRRRSPNPERPAPPAETHAETFYFAKQREHQTHVAVVLTIGETFRGIIKWYDRTAIKIVQHDGPEIMLPKASIKYVYKEDKELRVG